jgi:predicted neuraminidase
MSVPVRLLAVVVAALLCLMVIRGMTPQGFGGFAADQPADSPGTGNCKPVFFRESINPDQGLPMVHVASLARMPDGITAAVWYGGTAECHPDVKIYFSQQEPGISWTSPRVIMTREQAERDLRRPVKALGNALLLAGSDGSLRMLFVTIAMGKWSGSQLNSCVSKDGGLTWSPAERLTLSPFFNFSELVRNRAVPRPGGGWCVPVYQEFLGKFPEVLWLGERNGKLTYLKTRMAGGCSSFQPSLVPLDERRGISLQRDYTAARRIVLSATHDGGFHWSAREATSLPNPDAGVSGLRLSDGGILVAFNDSAKDRSNLTLSISHDEGKTWKRIALLENEDGATFSYPFLMRSPHGIMSMAYTWKSRTIKVACFNEAWVREQEAADIKP